MSIFAKIDESIELLHAADGVHGTDGESNRSRSNTGNTDGVHGTDGEDFGSDESIPMEQFVPRKPRGKNARNSASLSPTRTVLDAKKRPADESAGNVGSGESDIDIVASDDEEYLTNGLRDTDSASEAGMIKRMFKADEREKKPANSVSAFFARMFHKSKRFVTYTSPLHEESAPNFARSSDAAINEALERWKEAERYFEMLPHNDLVDYAVYNLEAARRRYVFLLNMERKQTKLSQELGLSESFESERKFNKPMREHMMQIPEERYPSDVLPQ